MAHHSPSCKSRHTAGKRRNVRDLHIRRSSYGGNRPIGTGPEGTLPLSRLPGSATLPSQWMSAGNSTNRQRAVALSRQGLTYDRSEWADHHGRTTCLPPSILGGELAYATFDYRASVMLEVAGEGVSLSESVEFDPYLPHSALGELAAGAMRCIRLGRRSDGGKDARGRTDLSSGGKR